MVDTNPPPIVSVVPLATPNAESGVMFPIIPFRATDPPPRISSELEPLITPLKVIFPLLALMVLAAPSVINPL